MSSYNFKEVEESILRFWDEDSTYQKSVEKNSKGKDFYFLDGPPYTSGRIHIGQAWNKAMKDMVLRYKRMKGFKVFDRAGYDMHGLPTSNKVMEKLGLKNKDEVYTYGVASFIKECRALATENLNFMNEDFRRMGVWMDFLNAYQPVNTEFMEGEWWLVKKAYENNRLYEAEKVMHWCSNCSTALAKHELEYEVDTDESVFLKFKVKGKDNEYLIIWTTTPWTIPYNLGVMVNPESEYVRARVGSEVWIIAKQLAGVFISGVVEKSFSIDEELLGVELKDLEYIHPLHNEIDFQKFTNNAKIHYVVLSSEFVDTKSGSGLVHMAPGCGPEDYEVGHRNKIPPFNNLKEDGSFSGDMGKFSGWKAKVDDKKFIEEFDKVGCLVAKNPVEHEYAHCWRCKLPVVFRTTTQWFFKVEDLKDEMRELNSKVLWQPEWAGSRTFDSWLNNLRDNSISRQREWGTPVPIWKCDKCCDFVVIGSVSELRSLSGFVPEDIHKPWIDEITIPCKCGSVMKRIPDILDVWIDAGTASWSALDYPKKTDLFNRIWPPDFIIEGKDQIRGWFNLLLVASMVSMQKHSYKSVYMHGFVQDSLGRKMSKSLGNVISPYEVIEKYGSDTLRYYMIGGTRAGVDINYNFDDMKVKHRNLTILWNLKNFILDLSDQIDSNPTKIKDKSLDFEIEEKYIISKTNSAIRKVTELMEVYRIDEVPSVVEDLFLDISRSYLQLTREKVVMGTDDDKCTVLKTSYDSFLSALKLMAPITPFIAEKIYQELRIKFGLSEESVHLLEWPKAGKSDENLEKAMVQARNVIQAVLHLREKISRGVRWPIAKVAVVSEDDELKAQIKKLKDIIERQTNVKKLEIASKVKGLKVTVRANIATIKLDYPGSIPEILSHLNTKSSSTILKEVEEGKVISSKSGGISLKKEHLIIEEELPEHLVCAEIKGVKIYLDKTITDELEGEGFSREIMRRTQQLRKEAGMQKSDRIKLTIIANQKLKIWLSDWHDQIKERTGSVEVVITEQGKKSEKIKGEELGIEIVKV